MPIRKLSRIFYLVTAVLISLLILFVVLRSAEQRELSRAENVRHRSFIVADKLRQSTDDLTRMARPTSTPGIRSLSGFFGKYLPSATAICRNLLIMSAVTGTF
jgi:two-component system sensor histidine kinase/response regulator